MTYTLAAGVWTYFEEDIPWTDDPVGDSGWTGETGVSGTYDPTVVGFIVMENYTGGNSDVGIYGLQILPSEYDKENFIPVEIEIYDAGQMFTGATVLQFIVDKYQVV